MGHLCTRNFSDAATTIEKAGSLAKWAQHWLMIDWSRRRSASDLVWETCAGLASQLRNALDATSDETWSRHWRGDPAMRNRANAARFFLDAASCFQSINAEDQPPEANLPPVARWADPHAHERFFSQFMSQKLEALCGRFCDPVVDALTTVAFDLPKGRGSATVRGRRRMATGENRAEKTPIIASQAVDADSISGRMTAVADDGGVHEGNRRA